VRYVGFAALVAAFWLITAATWMVIHDRCHPPDNAPEAIASIPAAAPTAAPQPELRQRVATLRSLWQRSPRFGDNPLSGVDLAAKTPPPANMRPPNPLSKRALVAGMNAVKPSIHDCYLKFRVPGTPMVKVVIAKNGRVTTATVTGKFAGTPTGACVERAVKTAKFPQCDGFSTPYPFQLK
jgi:hypothetical protein